MFSFSIQVLFSMGKFWLHKKHASRTFYEVYQNVSKHVTFQNRLSSSSNVHLLSPSVMSRISGWTCWDTRGRSSVQPSSSGPIWCRGRWRCEIHLQYNLCHGSLWFSHSSACWVWFLKHSFQWNTFIAKTEREFTFECRSLFWWIQHYNQKEWKRDRTSCQSLKTNNGGEMHYGSYSPGQSEVRELLRRRRT